MPDTPWSQVCFTFPPDDQRDRDLQTWAHQHGFAAVDWCIWQASNGARLVIDPVPPPGPHGFEGTDAEAHDA